FGKGKVSAEPQRGPGVTDQGQDFYVSLSTDVRDQPGLSTLVVAGSNRLLFDCGVLSSVPVSATRASAVTALFLTNLDTTTLEGIDRVLNNAAPPRIWGPAGTREWMLKALGNRELDSQRPPFTVIDLQEGVVSEAGKVTVTAIETAPSRLA